MIDPLVVNVPRVKTETSVIAPICWKDDDMSKTRVIHLPFHTYPSEPSSHSCCFCLILVASSNPFVRVFSDLGTDDRYTDRFIFKFIVLINIILTCTFYLCVNLKGTSL